MITSSRLELARRCVGAFTLPHTDERTVEADAGNERHADDERAINRGDIPDALAEAWPGYTWRAEVAYAYNVATGEARELGAGIHRAYPELGPFWVYGTADAVGRGPAGELAVADKKGYDAVTRAAHNPQLRFLALAAARTYGVDDVDIAITHEVRSIDRARMEAFDLDEEALLTKQTYFDVAQAQHDARNGLPVAFATGRHCRWCPAFGACPEQRKLVALVRTEAASAQVEQLIPFRDDATAADMYALWKRLGMLHKRLGAALHARASEAPIPLGDGRMFGPEMAEGNDKLDGDIVYEVVRAKFGQDVADAATERSATKKRLREALGFVGARGQVAALERSVLDEVRAKGGLRNEIKVRICEYTPAAALKDGAA